MTDPSVPDWINAVAAAVGSLAVLGGLLGANAKINEAQKTAMHLRRSEVSEELIALAYNVEDALREIRNPMISIPKDKVEDKTYTYQRRYERIVKHNDLFKRLRDAQIRVRAVIGNKQVDNAVEELFKARNEIAIDIEILADYASEDNVTSEVKEHKMKLKRVISGSFSECDDFGQKIISAVKKIEEKLSPIARLENSK